MSSSLRGIVLDCIVIGYNQIDFNEFARTQKQMGERSGAYKFVSTNSLLIDGKRMSTMDLLQRVLRKARPEQADFSPFEAPNLAVCYLSSFLRRHGLESGIINYFNNETEKLAAMLDTAPTAVAITTTYYVEGTPIKEIVDFIRARNPETPIIVGGPHILTVASDYEPDTQDYLLDFMGADIYIVDSQGENTLAEVVNRLKKGADLAGVANLIYRHGTGEFHRTERCKESNSLEENTIDWSGFDPEFVRPMVYMRTARSCPFACAFCNFPVLAGEHGLAGLDAVESEMRQLHELGVQFINFIDDTFNVPLPRFKKLLRMMIKNEFNFKWVSFFRCSNADDEVFALMAESGCIGVFLGIESGDQGILNNMNKFANLDRYAFGIRKLTEHGIVSHGSFVIGFPGETEETVKNTRDFIESSPTTFYSPQLFFLDPQSPIYKKRAAEFEIQGAGYSWTHKTMDWREGAEWSRYLFANIKNSTPLTVYGDIWAVPYMISQGITIESFNEFSKIARDMIIAGFDDTPTDFTMQEQRMEAIFAPAHETVQARPVKPH